MTDPYAKLAAEVALLMRANADALSTIETLERARARDGDTVIREIVEVLDSTERVATRISDATAREAIGAVAVQIELLLASRGCEFIEFNRGELAPLAEIEVIGTVDEPALPEMAVTRLLHRGIRRGPTILRRAGVEVVKRGAARA